MAQVITEEDNRFSKENMNPHRQMKITRGDGSGRHAEVQEVRKMSKSAELSMLAEDLPIGLGRPTGFAKYISQKVAGRDSNSVRVAGGRVDLETGEPISFSEEMKLNKRANSERTGFADFAERQDGNDFHEDQRLDNEEGPVGFEVGFHGTPEDSLPEDRDKKVPYGGNMVAGSEKESTFTKPSPKKRTTEDDDFEDLFKEGDELLQDEKDSDLTPHKKTELNRNPNGRSQPGVKTADPALSISVQSEPVETEDNRDQFHDLLPEEPSDMYVPSDEDEQVDPLMKKEPKFPSDGDWGLPGVDQGYPEQKVKNTKIMGMMKFKMNDGRVYIGKIASQDEGSYYIDGIQVGSRQRIATELPKDEIESMRHYSIKQNVGGRTMDSLTTLYDKALKTAGPAVMDEEEIVKEEGGPGSGKKSVPGQGGPKGPKEIKDEDVDNFIGDVNKGVYGKNVTAEDLIASVRKEAKDSGILKKYFGNTPSKTDEMKKDDAIARTDASKGDGDLYGDDMAMKDQLRQHEKKMAWLKSEIAELVKSSEDADDSGDGKKAEALLIIAQTRSTELKNLGVKYAQLKKQSQMKKTAAIVEKPFFEIRENGEEHIFSEQELSEAL